METSIGKILYTASATSTGGRSGRAVSPDGRLDLALSRPEEMGGEGGDGTNPEQLFAAGYSACFEGALRLVAHRKGVEVGAGASVTADVSFGKTEDGGFGLAVGLTGRLPGVPRQEALALMEEAHGVCPYSRATRGNIPVELAVA